MSVAPPRAVGRAHWQDGLAAELPCPPARITCCSTTERMPLLDVLRAFSAHVIVWHHLMLYGPLSDAAEELAPTLSSWLIEHGPNAVQVFLVIGGLLTAQSLAKRRDFRLSDGYSQLRRRYVRLAGPYLCVLVIAVLANWLAGQCMDDESISAFPTPAQLLAHAAFLQDLLGYEALSAGVWYLAIDFQLVATATVLWWLSRRLSTATGLDIVSVSLGLLFPLATASLLWFNRHPSWDSVALYFLGSYALGMLIGWALSGSISYWYVWGYVALVVLALGLEFRPRLAVGLATGVLIILAANHGWLTQFPTNRSLRLAGGSSYSLFLIHFPVCLLVNAWLATWAAASPPLGAIGMISAYVLSVLASIAFYFGVERRFARI